MFLVDFAAIARTVGHLSKSAEVMKLVNNLMKAPEMAVTMHEFSKEMTKVSSLLLFLLHKKKIKKIEDSFSLGINNGIYGWHCILWNFMYKEYIHLINS
jgi:Ca2+-binding EF-hand superfamily protein